MILVPRVLLLSRTFHVFPQNAQRSKDIFFDFRKRWGLQVFARLKTIKESRHAAMCKPDSLPERQMCCTPVPSTLIQVTTFSIADFSSRQLLAPNAPPPKLYYVTFWKKVSRKMYDQAKIQIFQEIKRQRS